jgi:hypothetical protein
MRFIMYLVIVAAMLAAYVSSPDVHLLPASVKYLPDALSVLILVYVFSAGVSQQFRYVNSKYWLIFGALAIAVACGPLVNGEAVGPIVNGVRYYLRAIPLFFLPAVVQFKQRDLKNYLKLILGLSLLQLPMNVYQRWSSLAKGWYTGDVVIGTLMDSGFCTLFLICVMCVLGAFMLRGRVSKFYFGICFVLMLIAISINETKVTIIMLPLALLMTFIVAAPPGRRLVGTAQAIAALIVAAAIFVPLYDSLNLRSDGTKFYSISDFLGNSEALEKYMDHDAAIGSGKEAGRGDAMRAPFRALSSDPIKMTFGLGLGNVSKSGLGEQYSGRYMLLYWMFALELSITTFLFEIGLLGTLLVLFLHFMLLKDALYVAKHDQSMIGTLALGYMGVWLTVTIGLFYATLHTSDALSFLFFFFSGLIAAQRQRLVVSRAKVRADYSHSPSLTPMKLKAG